LGRTASVSLVSRDYALPTGIVVPVDVSPDIVELKQMQQQLMKKFKAQEKSLGGQIIKEAAKLKFVSMEAIRADNPEELNGVSAALEEVENAVLSYTPQIQATVDQAYDTKNHQFVTDPIGADIFRAATDVIDRQEQLVKVLKDRLGLTPRNLAQHLYDMAVSDVLPPDMEAPPPAGKNDLPGWLVEALQQTQKFKNISSQKELLDTMFPSKVPETHVPVVREAKANGKDVAIGLLTQEIIAAEGAAPGSPEHKQLLERMKDVTVNVPAAYAELEQANAEFVKKMQARKERFAQNFLNKDEARADLEEYLLFLRYHGENGIARKAVNGFLLTNAEPSDEEKVKFMKTLRDALRARRKAHGIIVRELYPNLDIPAQVNADDATLLNRFNRYADSL